MKKMINKAKLFKNNLIINKFLRNKLKIRMMREKKKKKSFNFIKYN